MKKKFMKIEGVRAIANTLSGDAKEFADAVVAAFEEAEADEEQEHDITSLKTKIEEIEARFAKSDEEVAEKIAKVKNEIMRLVGGNSANVKDKFTKHVCNAIGHALLTSKDKNEAIANVIKVAEESGIVVARTKNDISGLSFEQIVDYAIQFKQDDSDEVFDALYKTNRSKWFFCEIDDTDKDQIAKQWAGLGADGVKEIQEIAVNGKEIATKYIYKRQRMAAEDMDDAAEHGQEAALEGDVRTELRKAVKALAVKSMLVGDQINGNGSKVTVFETIGTKVRTDLFTTVLAPATAGVVTLTDIRALAAKVKTDVKWLFISEDLKLALARRLYAAGGTEFFFTDEELAAQIGVDRIYTKDYLSTVEGLHAVVIDPNQYWVKIKNEADVAWPEYEKNARHFMYEMNMGGGIRGIQSTAVLREASEGSSSAA